MGQACVQGRARVQRGGCAPLIDALSSRADQAVDGRAADPGRRRPMRTVVDKVAYSSASESTGGCAHRVRDRNAGEERSRLSRATERARMGALLTCGNVSCERVSPWALCGFPVGNCASVARSRR